MPSEHSTPEVTAVVLATWNFGLAAADAAGTALEDGADSHHAAAAGAEVVERDPATGPYFVGVGGTPNSAGTIEMDAAVMRGRACEFGAVLALSNEP